VSYVHDPFAFEKMEKLIFSGIINYKMTDLQQREIKFLSKHCSYAFKDDYPWGTVEINGEKKVVCKCINLECAVFDKCRNGVSSFNEDELRSDLIGIRADDKVKLLLDDQLSIGRAFKEKLIGSVVENIEIFEVENTPDKEIHISRKEEMDETTKLEINITKFEIKEKEKYIDEISDKTKLKKTGDTEILEEFIKWMTENQFKISIAKGYVNAIKSANNFAVKKNIWERNIYEVEAPAELLQQIEELQNSAYFKAAMKNYIIALNCYSDFLTDYKADNEDSEKLTQKLGQINENVEIDESLEKNVSQRDNEGKGKGFEKFIEVEQDVVIFAEPSERIIVNAGPGTGKTHTLIEKLIYMVNEQEVDPEEILVLCFSRAAVEVIEKRLQDAYLNERLGMNWHSIDIRTFDSFATHLLSYAAENEKDLLGKSFSLGNLDYDGRIGAATDIVRKSRELIEQCSHLFVDEVQDLVSVRAQFVKQLLLSISDDAGYTLLGDACQSIYDYQIHGGEIDSSKFYSWLFEIQVDSKFWSFGINYRQASELEKLGNQYRDAILTGSDNSRIKATNEIFKNVEELLDFDLRNTSVEEIGLLTEDKNLGILTRTNGQALKISTWFRTAGIPHNVQKRLTDNSLNIWIANILRDYENDTLDRDTFVELYSEKGDFTIDPEDVWNVIQKTQNESKNRYHVHDILYGILNNSKAKEFYASSGDEQITISNIHRSKGREFHKIVLPNEVLVADDKETKDLLEHKVSYVAVTRAKEKIYRTSIGKQYIRTDKKGDRRAFATGVNIKGKKSRLSHVEIGRAHDLDSISFADDFNVQPIFDESEMLIGERVILVKNKEQSEASGYICYSVYLEEYASLGCIGRTSEHFFSDLKRILQETYKLVNIDPYDYMYPDRFLDIYIDDVISIVSSVSPLAVAGKRYNDMMVWKGITLVGFAQIERNAY